MNVELSDFVGCGCAGIFEVHGNVDRFAPLDLGAIQLEIGKGELRIAKTVAERIQRSALLIPVALALIFRSLRGVVRIVDGELADIARPGDGKLAAEYGIAEEKIGDGVAALRAGIPGIQDGRDVFGCPLDIERAPVEE